MKKLSLVLVAILTASICMAECPLTTWGSSDESGNIRVNIGLTFRFGKVKKDFSETFCKTVKTVRYDFAPVPIESDVMGCIEATPIDPNAIATTLGESQYWSAGKTAIVCVAVAGTAVCVAIFAGSGGDSGNNDKSLTITGNGNQVNTSGESTTSGESSEEMASE